MKILLAGNAGFVGPHIQSALESDGIDNVHLFVSFTINCQVGRESQTW